MFYYLLTPVVQLLISPVPHTTVTPNNFLFHECVTHSLLCTLFGSPPGILSPPDDAQIFIRGKSSGALSKPFLKLTSSRHDF